MATGRFRRIVTSLVYFSVATLNPTPYRPSHLPHHSLPDRATERRPGRSLTQMLASPTGVGGALLACLLALAFANWLYPSGYLRGTSTAWQHLDGDITQYIAGFNAFVHEPWQWPLLRITSINWPVGTLLTFVDGIPLYAMVLKLFSHGKDLPFRNPYGAWIAICYTLQGVGAWWICRETGNRSWSALVALTLLLLACPALTFRIDHTSLMSHWLLVFAIAVYLRSARQGRLAWIAWSSLVFCAFYINVYLFCMVSLVFAADTARHLRPRQWRLALLAPLSAYGMLALSLYLTMLPLDNSSLQPEWGFGYYSMNLLAPLDGGHLLQFAHPMPNDGQREGFNYLGIFFLAVAFYAFCLSVRHDARIWLRHSIFLLVAILCTVYALSNLVYLGPVKVADWQMPLWSIPLTSQFRASGRFFWPVGYAAIVFTVLTVARHAPRAPWIFVILLVLHYWDLQPDFARSRSATSRPFETHLDEARWDAFFGQQTDTVYFYPPFRCGKNDPGKTVLPAMAYAARHQLNLSTGYVARAVKPCDNYAAEIGAARAPGTAFIFVKSEFPDLQALQTMLGGDAASRCIEADFAYLCTRRGMNEPEKAVR